MSTPIVSPSKPGEVVAVQLGPRRALSLPSEWVSGPVLVAVSPAMLLQRADGAARIASALRPWHAAVLPECRAGVVAGELATAIAQAARRGDHVVYATDGDPWADEVVHCLALARRAARNDGLAGCDEPAFRLHIVETAAGRPRHVATTPLDRLATIMARLLAEDGCPWDREQTHASLGQYLVEEAAEVLEAIERRSADMLVDELGDVLLQIAFHAAIAAETGDFDLLAVAAAIEGKMIHRHPHVFADWHVDSSREVLANWELLKAEEPPALAEPAEQRRWRSLRKAGVQVCLAALDFAFAAAGAREDAVHAHDAMLDAVAALREQALRPAEGGGAARRSDHGEKGRDGPCG